MTQSAFALVADVGGTHARFALVRQPEGRLESIKVFRCDEFPGLEQAIAAYVHDNQLENIDRVCLAVAGPVSSNRVEVTNTGWTFNKEDLRRRFDIGSLSVINDLEAGALGLKRLTSNRLQFLGGGTMAADQPQVLIGIGTGLGLACLRPDDNAGTAFASEGGHRDFAPSDELECAVLQRLQAAFGHVSAERLLSAHGLLNLYRAMAHLKGIGCQAQNPRDVTELALASDAFALEVVKRYCQILGRFAGDTVLTVGAWGGVCISGKLPNSILKILSDGEFREAFERKGPMSGLLRQIATGVVDEPYLGLLGALDHLERA